MRFCNRSWCPPAGEDLGVFLPLGIKLEMRWLLDEGLILNLEGGNVGFESGSAARRSADEVMRCSPKYGD